MSDDFAQHWHEIEPLLDHLLDMPRTARSEWLRRRGTDRKLSTLITRALDGTAHIDAVAGELGACLHINDAPLDALPDVAGYRVLRFVGAGGMASVFQAQRELPGATQPVALKLLRIDVHDPEERRRFLREQAILARLRHANIAQLLDAGFTAAGTPFLALEFVDGGDLISHCEQRRLRTDARLALFRDVCRAVEHAHRHLIVHRDLKPHNVLVDEEGSVKLVDFGIAKLLDGDDAQTRTTSQRLTRRYAAPEQLAGDAATTAMDVYALGVLLAELLGVPRAQREGATPECGIASAALRHLGADLGAVVREATQHDPARRYAGVTALREDIERHLRGVPLRARAPTLAYRVCSFVKRHAVIVCAVAIVTAGLATTTAVSVHEARRAYMQTQLALVQAQRADAVKSFLESLFDTAAPGANAGETALDLLVRGREHAERDFVKQPALHVEVLALIGDLQRRSGHAEAARESLERAASLALAQFGAADRRTLHVEYLLAENADALGRAREARARLERALGAFHGHDAQDTEEQVHALAWIAGLDERLGDSTAAIVLGERALALARRALPDDSAALTEAWMNLGWIEFDAGHADRAEPLLREALARKRHALGERHPDVADALAILASAVLRRGRGVESERLLRTALDIDATTYSRPHPHTAWHLNDLANTLALAGKLDEAASTYAQALAVDEALAPASALNEAVTIGNLARVRWSQGDYAAAENGMRDAIARKQALLGADYGDNGRSHDLSSLAEILIARRGFDEARSLLDDALDDTHSRRRSAHPDVAFALTVMAELMAATGAQADAAARASEAVAIFTALSDTASDKALRARLVLGEALLSLHRESEAQTQFAVAVAAAQAASPPSPLLARAQRDLSRSDPARVAATRPHHIAALARPASGDALRAAEKIP